MKRHIQNCEKRDKSVKVNGLDFVTLALGGNAPPEPSDEQDDGDAIKTVRQGLAPQDN